MKKGKFIIAALFGIILHIGAKAQLNEIKDPRIDTLSKLIAKEQAKIATTKSTTTEVLGEEPIEISVPKDSITIGFRIQIFMGKDQTKLYDDQDKFKSLYPDIATYVTYNQPNYRLKVGDFWTREEAVLFLEKLKSNFTTAMFIFKEEIIAPKVLIIPITTVQTETLNEETPIK